MITNKETLNTSPETGALDKTLDTTLTLVEFLTDTNRAVKDRYTQLAAMEHLIDPKIRAILRYCVDYEVKPGVSTERITLMHDPTDVVNTVNRFEQTLEYGDDIVLLPAVKIFEKQIHPPKLLGGNLDYKLHLSYNYWQVQCDGDPEPAFDFVKIPQTIWNTDELHSQRRLGCVPIVGAETAKAYAIKLQEAGRVSEYNYITSQLLGQ